jgi:hypothetical protein
VQGGRGLIELHGAGTWGGGLSVISGHVAVSGHFHGVALILPAISRWALLLRKDQCALIRSTP